MHLQQWLWLLSLRPSCGWGIDSGGIRINEFKDLNMASDIKLFNMDCMEALREMEDNQFDLAIVDPPYGIGMSGGNVGYKGNNNLERKEWDAEIPTQEYFDQLMRVSKHQIIWGGNYFPLPPSRCFVVWDKGEGFYGRSYAEGELAWCSWDANARIYKRDPLANGDYKGKIHPTQKPVALYKWLLKNYGKEGDKILDTHLGSGSIAIACHDAGFDLCGYELDEDYYVAVLNRLEEHKRQGQFDFS
jgi:site-specific DNA-methyltransferase (adenine-specific)